MILSELKKNYESETKIIRILIIIKLLLTIYQCFFRTRCLITFMKNMAVLYERRVALLLHDNAYPYRCSYCRRSSETLFWSEVSSL